LVVKVTEIVKPRLEEKEIITLEKLFNLLEESYGSDEYFKKRKVGAIHVVLGPRCFGHLFDKLFNLANRDILERLEELNEFSEFLEY